jgi:hypothetical protein
VLRERAASDRQDDWPTAPDHYRNGTVAKILLIPNVLIHRYDYVEPDAFCSRRQQSTISSVQLIRQTEPSHSVRCE